MSPDDHERDHADDGAGDVGSLADEAVRLLGALSDWARDQGSEAGRGPMQGLAGLAGQAARAVDEHLATGSAECAWCPICRTVHALRELSPEVRAQVGAAATALLQAASGLLSGVAPDHPSEEPPERPPDGPPARRPGMERIDLSEDSDWPEDTSVDGDGEG